MTSHDSSLIHSEEAVLTRTPTIIKRRINKKTAFYVTRVIHYITAYDLIYRVYIV